MREQELGLKGLYSFDAAQFPDHRGNYVLWYEEETFAKAVGYPLKVAKTHHAVSGKDVVRGIHFTALPAGQGKYVYCARGSIRDVVVDLRIGSPTYGQWVANTLSDTNFKALYIPQGFGHGYAALEDNSVLVYLCTTAYSPEHEVAIDPLDPEIGIDWPTKQPIMSDRDVHAQSLAQARAAGLLADYETCLAWTPQ